MSRSSKNSLNRASRHLLSQAQAMALMVSKHVEETEELLKNLPPECGDKMVSSLEKTLDESKKALETHRTSAARLRKAIEDSRKGITMPKSVLQPWVMDLTLMQQAVLLTAIRGPDGIRKDHVAKVILRWYRRCILVTAFEGWSLGQTVQDAYKPGGGSFTGPCDVNVHGDLDAVVDGYLRTVDETPHHFQLHLMHSAEILGYKHPSEETRAWWNQFYRKIVNDAHLNPETEEQMDRRLGDSYAQWREAEEVVAR